MNLSRTVLTAMIIALTAIMAEAGQTRPVSFPDNALVKFHFDKTLSDSTGNHSLKKYNMTSGSAATLRSPEFTEEGVLMTESMTPDIKIPDLNDHVFSLVLRMRLPDNLNNYAPITLTSSSDRNAQFKAFIINGDSIKIFGKKKLKDDELSWWINPLPKPDADGYTTIIYQPYQSFAYLYLADRLYDYHHDVAKDKRFDRMVIGSADSVVLCDLAVYDQVLSYEERYMINGFDRGYKYKFGEKDEEGTITEYTEKENNGYKRWIIADIIMVVIALLMMLKKKRTIVAYRFMGFPIVVLIFAASIALDTWIYKAGELTLEFWKEVACLAAYLVVAWIPLAQDEIDEMAKEEAAERQHKARMGGGKPFSGRLKSMMSKLAFGTLTVGLSAFEKSKRTYETVNQGTGEVVSRREGVDVQSFFAEIMSAVVGVFINIAIAGVLVSLIMRIALWILPWATALFFTLVMIKYIVELIPEKNKNGATA